MIIFNLRRNPVLSTLIGLLAVLALATTAAQAQEKPFKISGKGVGPMGLPLPGDPNPRPHWIIGNATHLGKHYGEGTELTDATNVVFHDDGRITGEFGSGSPFTFVGANGELLVCNYGRTAFGASTPGTFELVPAGPPGSFVYVAYFVAEFVPVGSECTGKFAGVAGSWVMYAKSGPFLLGSSDPFDYSWEGEGSLRFQKRK